MCGLRKQVTDTIEGTLEPRGKKAKRHAERRCRVGREREREREKLNNFYLLNFLFLHLWPVRTS